MSRQRLRSPDGHAARGSASPSPSISTFTFSDLSPPPRPQPAALAQAAARPAAAAGGIRASSSTLSGASSSGGPVGREHDQSASIDREEDDDAEESDAAGDARVFGGPGSMREGDPAAGGARASSYGDRYGDASESCDDASESSYDASKSSYDSDASSRAASEDGGDNDAARCGQARRVSGTNPEVGKLVVHAVRDYLGVTDEELDVRVGDRLVVLNDEDPNWWYCRSIRRPEEEGYVPASSICAENDGPKVGARRRGPPSLYGSGSIYAARVSGAAPGSLDTPYLARWTKRLQSTDMLDFFEHMPRGCRPSTLARISHEGRFDAAARLAPRANTDGIGFKDLFLDEKKPKLRPVAVNCNIAFSLISARNIPMPVPTSECQITGRHVRIAVFDKVSVKSNILVVPALLTEEGWKFTTKASLLFPKDNENTCLVRTNDVDFNLCVLFELCVALCIGNATDGSVDTGETSCGWGVLPLYAADGSPVEKKTYDVKLYGGTPYESDVELGGPVGKRGIWETLTNANRTPMLSIRLWSLGKSAMKRINLLPETLITFLAYVPALAYYRQLQADAILVGKDEEPDLQVKCSPALAVLERIVDQWDLMRELIITWDLESRKIRRRDRRSGKAMRRHFARTAASIVPLLHCLDVPEHVHGDDPRDRVRAMFIERYRNEGPLTCLLAHPCTATHGPFDLQELCARPRLLPAF